MLKARGVFKSGERFEILESAEGVVRDVISREKTTWIRLEKRLEDFVLRERHRIDVGERARLFYSAEGKRRVVRAYEIFDWQGEVNYKHADTGYEFEVENAERDDFF